MSIRRSHSSPHTARLLVEQLEDRWTPASVRGGFSLAPLSPGGSEPPSNAMLFPGFSQRFPELALVVSQSGARTGVDRIASLLEAYARTGAIRIGDARFAAEQFINMVLAVPQKRAVGLGETFAPAELERWARDTVALFLDGCRGAVPAARRRRT